MARFGQDFARSMYLPLWHGLSEINSHYRMSSHHRTQIGGSCDAPLSPATSTSARYARSFSQNLYSCHIFNKPHRPSVLAAYEKPTAAPRTVAPSQPTTSMPLVQSIARLCWPSRRSVSLSRTRTRAVAESPRVASVTWTVSL